MSAITTTITTMTITIIVKQLHTVNSTSLFNCMLLMLVQMIQNDQSDVITLFEGDIKLSSFYIHNKLQGC